MKECEICGATDYSFGKYVKAIPCPGLFIKEDKFFAIEEKYDLSILPILSAALKNWLKY